MNTFPNSLEIGVVGVRALGRQLSGLKLGQYGAMKGTGDDNAEDIDPDWDESQVMRGWMEALFPISYADPRRWIVLRHDETRGATLCEYEEEGTGGTGEALVHCTPLLVSTRVP